MFIVHASVNTTRLPCKSGRCNLTQCWNGMGTAVVARVPTYLPVPTKIEEGELEILLRPRRDFGITVAIAAIAVSATVAAAAGISLATSIPTAEALNNLTASTAEALQTNLAVVQHLRAGIMIVNQRVDLLQESVEQIEGMLAAHCVRSMPGVCVTSTAWVNNSLAANHSRRLSLMLNGTWSAEFDTLTKTMRRQIFSINTTKVQIATAKEFATYVLSAVSHLKEWAGVGVLGTALVGAIILGLYCLCRLRAQARVERQIMVQAMLAIQGGETPQIWLSMLDQ